MLFPAPSARMVDVWHVIGLRGTGSDTFTVTDLYVPHAHSVARDKTARGARHQVRDNAVVQSQVAQSEVKLRAARLFLLTSLADIWNEVQRVGSLSLDHRMTIRPSRRRPSSVASATSTLSPSSSRAPGALRDRRPVPPRPPRRHHVRLSGTASEPSMEPRRRRRGNPPPPYHLVRQVHSATNASGMAKDSCDLLTPRRGRLGKMPEPRDAMALHRVRERSGRMARHQIARRAPRQHHKTRGPRSRTVSGRPRASIWWTGRV